MYRVRPLVPGRGRHPAAARRDGARRRREGARGRGLGRDGAGPGLVRARRRGRRRASLRLPRPRLGRSHLEGRTSTRSASSSAGCAPGCECSRSVPPSAGARGTWSPPVARTSAPTSSPTRRSASGRGAFYEAAAGPFLRVQADGESLPFADASFDVSYCVATLHHALDLPRMVAEMARVTRRGGHVLALNEGTRAVQRLGGRPGSGRGAHVRDQRARAHAVRVPLGVRPRRPRGPPGRAGRGVRRRWPAGRIGGRLLRIPGVGRSAATWFTQTFYGYEGATLVARKVGPRR